MKTIIMIITILIFSINSIYSQNFQWVQSAGGLNREVAHGVDVDAMGNVYITGSFRETANFGSLSLTTGSSNDEIYVARYNNSGTAQWVQKAGGAGSDESRDIVCDNSGNSYVTGQFRGTATFGSFTLTSIGPEDFFIAKYNSAGVVQWAVDAGQDSYVNSIAIDNSGNCYLSGYNYSYHAFISKYNSSGNLVWAKTSTGTCRANGVATDASGNVYSTGFFAGTVNFGSFTISSGSSSDYDIFIVKYNTAGTELWCKKAGGTGTDMGNALSLDASGNCFITGDFSQTAIFGSIPVTSSGDQDAFIAKYDNSGNAIWVKKGGSVSFDRGESIKTDASGNSYISGIYAAASVFGSLPLTNQGIFIVKYDNLGNALWANKAEGTFIDDYLFSCLINADASGNCYITGSYKNTAAFGTPPANISSNINSYDIFISKISPYVNQVTGTVFLDYDNDGIKDVGEPPYSNVIISYPSASSYSSPNVSGNYNMTIGTGPYNIQIPNPPIYYTSNPAIRPVNFSTYGNTSSGNNFGLHSISNISDMKITFINDGSFVMGFSEAHHITYKNVGTVIKSGFVELNYDYHLQYESASPGPDYLDETNHIVRWNYNNLLPLDHKDIKIIYTVPTNIPVFTVLASQATVSPTSGDQTVSDNTYILQQRVYSSHDPNNKSVIPSGNISPQQVSAGNYLNYTIRFQNTGNYPAQNVVVRDTLSSMLDITTFEMLSSGHNYTYAVSGNGIVEWTFNNIFLPDSTSDRLGSNGFISYRVKPKNNLSLGNEIKNTAHIFFDFNPDIITNTTVTKVAMPNVTLELRYRLEAMFPIRDTINVRLRNSFPPFAIVDSVKIYPGPDTSQYYRAIAGFQTQNNDTGNIFYIVVKHRNSVETWSALPVTLNSDTTVYDFTTSISKAYGNNMINTGGAASFYAGDLDNNGLIDLNDIIKIWNDANTFTTGYVISDLNGNGTVDLTDIIQVYNNSTKFIHFIRP